MNYVLKCQGGAICFDSLCKIKDLLIPEYNKENLAFCCVSWYVAQEV